jgi:enamine deaminase RidA (YjgF/YER057c/UK114 family)
MKQLQRRAINFPKPLGAYSQAMQVTAGTLVFVAGQVAVDANVNLVGKDDVMAQTRHVFENMGHVLANAGASFTNVVQFTTYLVGREAIKPFLNARAALFPVLFPNGDYPPNTLLIVAGLVREEFLVEIQAIAALP